MTTLPHSRDQTLHVALHRFFSVQKLLKCQNYLICQILFQICITWWWIQPKDLSFVDFPQGHVDLKIAWILSLQNVQNEGYYDMMLKMNKSSEYYCQAWTLILSCFLKLNLGLFSMKRIIHIPFAWAWLIQCSLMKCNEVYLDCFSLAIINSFVRNLPESPLWSTMQTWVHKVAWQKSSELSDCANKRAQRSKVKQLGSN